MSSGTSSTRPPCRPECPAKPRRRRTPPSTLAAIGHGRRVLADYEEVSDKGVEVIADFVSGPMADNVIPLDDLGNYPLHRLANALAFDHFCHLRNDILRPNGPIDRPAPPADELRVGAVLEWLIA